MFKMNLTDNQKAFEYAIYEIVGSYFKKAECMSPLVEKSMRMHFNETKVDSQYKMEDTCIAYTEKILLKELNEKSWEQGVAVKLIKLPIGCTEIRFIGPDFELDVRGKYKGSHSEIYYKVS